MKNIEQQQPQESSECKHEACSCPAADSSGYCSEACANAAQGGEGEGCPCGHPDCA